MRPLKSILFASLGALPGVLLAVFLANPYYLVIALLGGFIGFAFSLPGTSLTRVASLTGSVIVQHNLPGVGHQLTQIVENHRREKDRAKAREEAEYDFRKLDYEPNLIRLAPSAVATIQQLRPNWGLHAPIRANRWVEADGSYGVSLAYVDEWNSLRDVYTESKGIHIIVDRDAVPLLRGIRIVSPPNWDPGQFVFVFDEVAPAGNQLQSPADSTEAPNTNRKIPWEVILPILIAVSAFLYQVVKNPPQKQIQNVPVAVPNQGNGNLELREKMERGEDIPEPMLMLIGVDPQEYKKHQEAIRNAKDRTEDQQPVKENSATENSIEEK